jgi:ATP-dependent Clp protease protease subunit
MAAFILSSGTKGKRMALPNSEVMIHQPLGGARGQASDIEISARRILRLRSQINQKFSEQTGQPIEKIEMDTDRDYFMDAEEAKTYGLIDKIISYQFTRDRQG